MDFADKVAKGLGYGYLAFHGAQEKERERQTKAGQHAEDVAFKRETLAETRRGHELQYGLVDASTTINGMFETAGLPDRVKGPMMTPRTALEGTLRSYVDVIKTKRGAESQYTGQELFDLGKTFESGEIPTETIKTAQVEDVPGLGEGEPPVVSYGSREEVSPRMAALLKRPVPEKYVSSLTSARTAGAATERAFNAQLSSEARAEATRKAAEERDETRYGRRQGEAAANLALRERYQQYLEADMEPGQALAKARSDVSANFPDVSPTWGPMPVSPILQTLRKTQLEHAQYRNETEKQSQTILDDIASGRPIRNPDLATKMILRLNSLATSEEKTAERLTFTDPEKAAPYQALAEKYRGMARMMADALGKQLPGTNGKEAKGTANPPSAGKQADPTLAKAEAKRLQAAGLTPEAIAAAMKEAGWDIKYEPKSR